MSAILREHAEHQFGEELHEPDNRRQQGGQPAPAKQRPSPERAQHHRAAEQRPEPNGVAAHRGLQRQGDGGADPVQSHSPPKGALLARKHE